MSKEFRIDSEEKYNIHMLGYYKGKCEAYERLLVKLGWLARVCDMYDRITIKDDDKLVFISMFIIVVK